MASSETPDTAVSAATEIPHQSHNRFALLAHQAIFRVAWIFKTESVIMPAFLDSISESGVIRGALPLLNRTGQSLAPLLLARRLSAAPLKTAWLSRTTFLMGMPFLFLSGSVAVADAQLPPWFAMVFLIAYVIFFCLHGVNDMTLSTVLGKLIAVRERGRLQAAASTIGTTAAVSLALLLLSGWLQRPGQSPFQPIFLFVGSAMMLAGISSKLLREQADAEGSVSEFPGKKAVFRQAFQRIAGDPVLRRLCLVAVLFVSSQTLFPHYQKVGLARQMGQRTVLMDWVIAQHLGAVCFSMASGLLADRFGTRAALRLLLPCAAFAPVLAILLEAYVSPGWFWITFFWIGLVPVTLRVLVNYVIEIATRDKHPEYISTLNLCMAVPFLCSPLLGALVDWTGHVLPFLIVAFAVGIGAVLTLTMQEPRQAIGSEKSSGLAET